MIEENATVVAVDEEAIWVEAETRSACGRCGSSSSCGTSVLAGLFGSHKNRLRLGNPGSVDIGDRAVIGIPDQILSQASITAYLIPLLGMIVFAIASRGLGHSEPVQAIASLGGLLLGLWAVGRITRARTPAQRFAPVLIRLYRGSSLNVDFFTSKESTHD